MKEELAVNPYLPIGMQFLVALGFVSVSLLASWLIGPKGKLLLHQIGQKGLLQENTLSRIASWHYQQKQYQPQMILIFLLILL